MKNNFINTGLVLTLIILAAHTLQASAKHPSCKPSGRMTGTEPPPEKFNPENGSEHCVAGTNYTTYKCSPPVSCNGTKAVLTVNSFQKGGDGGAESECDEQFHSDHELVVALSTGWFNKKGRCNQTITIRANGRNVTAKVVDECDSTAGCDETHDYQPPCPNNIVDGSKAVWDALGVDTTKGELEVTWTDDDAHF